MLAESEDRGQFRGRCDSVLQHSGVVRWRMKLDDRRRPNQSSQYCARNIGEEGELEP